MSTTAGRSVTAQSTEAHARRVNAARTCISEARTNVATVEQIGENSGRYSQGAEATLGWAHTAIARAVVCLDGLEDTEVTAELHAWIAEVHASLDALDAADDEPEPTYSIVRFRKNGAREVMSTGHSLAEVTEHCGREDTHGPGWFDGYAAE